MVRRIVWISFGVVAIAVLAIWLVYIPSQLTLATREPLTTTPSSLGVGYRDVAFPARGGGPTIRAWWMEAAGARAVLIFAHGANANRRDEYARGLEIAKFLTQRRISVLAPDLRNAGLSDSAGDGRLTFGVTEAYDILGAIDFAAAHAPKLPIFLLGDSMGGATAIYAAAADTRVRRVVLFDPLLNPRSAELGAAHASLNLPRWLLAPSVWSADVFFAPDVPRRDPLKIAKGLTIPVLLIQDDRDPVCKAVYARALAAANRHVALWLSTDPGPENAVIAASGGWGAHVAAYRLHPQEMEQQLARFLIPAH